jgi:uncharacterized cysteine cluster protein YcgN (CxxCxxCC family)
MISRLEEAIKRYDYANEVLTVTQNEKDKAAWIRQKDAYEWVATGAYTKSDEWHSIQNNPDVVAEQAIIRARKAQEASERAQRWADAEEAKKLQGRG